MLNLRKISTLILATIALTFTSCDSWEPDLDVKTGTLDLSQLNPNVDTSYTEVLTRVNDGIDTSGYIVTLYDSKESVVNVWRYADMPQILTLPVGDYKIEIASHQADVAEWDTPLYKGSVSTTVKDGEISRPGSVKCSMAGAKISIKYSEALEKALSDDANVIVSLDDNAILNFTKSETRSGCFNLLPDGDASFVAKLSGKVNGSDVTVSRAETGVKPACYYILTFSLKTGSIDPSIVVDVTVTEEDVDINIGADMPTITSQTLDLSTVTELTLDNYESIVALIDISAPKGIKELHVKIESDLLTPEELMGIGLSDEFDLCNPGEFAEPLSSLGFPVGDEVLGKTQQPFDITFFLSLLVYFPGNNNFYITVVDNDGNSVSQGVLFHVPAE